MTLPVEASIVDEIVLVGGEGQGQRLDNVELWQTPLTPYPNLPTPIYGFAAVVHDSRLYLIGGTDEDDEELCSVEVFDLSIGLWCRGVPSMHHRRTGAMAVAVDSKLFVAGGNGGDDSGYLHSVEQWCVIGDTSWSPLAELCTARADAASVSRGTHFYVIGGRNGGQILRSGEVFSQDFGIWHELPPMQVPRAHCGAVEFRDCIMVAGGFNDTVYLNSVELFRIEDSSWTAVKPLNVPRASFGMATIASTLYVLGGRLAGDILDSVEQYDPASDDWQMTTPLQTARACFGLATLQSELFSGCAG